MAHTSYGGVLRAALGPKGKWELQKCCLTWSTSSRKSRWDGYYVGSITGASLFHQGLGFTASVAPLHILLQAHHKFVSIAEILAIEEILPP